MKERISKRKGTGSRHFHNPAGTKLVRRFFSKSPAFVAAVIQDMRKDMVELRRVMRLPEAKKLMRRTKQHSLRPAKTQEVTQC
jgi:hypothetical protein